MPLFEREIANVRNPAYGASLLHAVVRGYVGQSEAGAGIPVPHLFVALPLLLNPRALDAVSHTHAGLRNVAEKLDNGPETGADLLRTLLSEAKRARRFTLESLKVLMLAKLVRLDPANATVSLEAPVKVAPPLSPEGYNEGLKLGKWLATLSTFEISSITKVVY